MGRPCYYWVIPKAQCIASIKFENSRCDSNMFQDWVAGSMNFRVELPEYKKVTTDSGLVRLQFSEDESNPYKYYYQFDLSLRTLSTSSAPLQELREKVTHIIRRETVSLNVKDERKGWVKHSARSFSRMPPIKTPRVGRLSWQLKPDQRLKKLEIS